MVEVLTIVPKDVRRQILSHNNCLLMNSCNVMAKKSYAQVLGSKISKYMRT